MRAIRTAIAVIATVAVFSLVGGAAHAATRAAAPAPTTAAATSALGSAAPPVAGEPRNAQLVIPFSYTIIPPAIVVLKGEIDTSKKTLSANTYIFGKNVGGRTWSGEGVKEKYCVTWPWPKYKVCVFGELRWSQRWVKVGVTVNDKEYSKTWRW